MKTPVANKMKQPGMNKAVEEKVKVRIIEFPPRMGIEPPPQVGDEIFVTKRLADLLVVLEFAEFIPPNKIYGG